MTLAELKRLVAKGESDRLESNPWNPIISNVFYLAGVIEPSNGS